MRLGCGPLPTAVGFIGIPTNKCNNSGGHWYREGATPKTYHLHPSEQNILFKYVSFLRRQHLAATVLNGEMSCPCVFLLFNKGPLGREVWNPGNSNSFTQDLQRLDIPDVWTTGSKGFWLLGDAKIWYTPEVYQFAPENFRWKGRWSFPFGARQFFRGEVLNFQRISPRLACKGNGSFDWPFRFNMNNIEKILWRWTIKPTAWKWQVFLVKKCACPPKKVSKVSIQTNIQFHHQRFGMLFKCFFTAIS